MKKQYEHVSSCIKDFHTKLYPQMRLKSESKEDNTNKSSRQNNTTSLDLMDDIVEISMEIESTWSQI